MADDDDDNDRDGVATRTTSTAYNPRTRLTHYTLGCGLFAATADVTFGLVSHVTSAWQVLEQKWDSS